MTSPNAISPDGRHVAELHSDSILRVYDAASRQLEHTCQLPPTPASISSQRLWGWSGNCQHLVLPFGGVWWHQDVEVYSNRRTSGVLFVHLQSGACVTELLPDQRYEWARCWCCPTAGPGLLLVCHRDADDTAFCTMYDCTGVRVASTALPDRDIDGVHWERSGQAIMLDFLDPQEDFVWNFAANMPLFQVHTEDLEIRSSAWETPYTGRMLAGFTRTHFVILDTPAVLRQAALPQPQRADKQWGDPEWGVRLVLAAFSRQGMMSKFNSYRCDQLQLYTEAQGQLTLAQTVTASPRHFCWAHLDVSADGELLATLTQPHLSQNSQGMRDCHLAIVHLATGALQEFALPDSARACDFFYVYGEQGVRWTPDGTAVLVSSHCSLCSWLFRFA